MVGKYADCLSSREQVSNVHCTHTHTPCIIWCSTGTPCIVCIVWWLASRRECHIHQAKQAQKTEPMYTYKHIIWSNFDGSVTIFESNIQFNVMSERKARKICCNDLWIGMNMWYFHWLIVCVCMGQTLSKTMFCTAAVGYFFSIFPQQPVARILNGAAWYHIMCTNVCILYRYTRYVQKKTALSNKSIAFAYIFANHFKLCELLVKVKKKKTKKKKKEKNKKKANHTD